MRAWIGSFLLASVPLFVAIDPVGMAGLFMGLTADMPAERRIRLARQAALTALAVGLAFMVGGRALLAAVGVTIADFQVAGGIILLIIGVRSLLEEDRQAIFESEELGVVPLGLPLIAGPAMLTALLVLMDTQGASATVAALFANLWLNYLCMRHVRAISARLGRSGIRALSKITALLLVAIAVNLVRRGVQTYF